MSTRRRASTLVVASLLTTVAVPSAADQSQDPKGECFDASERAQELRSAGKLADARARLLVCVREGCPDVVRNDCARWLAEIDRLLPTVVLGARDSRGRDLPDVTVHMDGAVLAQRISGQAIAVDPGEHVFRFEHPGAEPVELRAVIGEGEKGRSVVASFPGPPGAAVGGDEWTPRDVGTIAVGGFGLAAAGVGAVLWIVGTSEIDDLRDQPCNSPGPGGTCDVDAARAKLLVGDIAVATGVIAIGVATLLYLTRPRANITPRAAGMRVSF